MKLEATKVEVNIGDKLLVIETGKIARQASGSVMISMGDSKVLVTAVMGEERDVDFFPLTIDYIEKTYAGGKIPGGFFKREGKLSEKETLVSRLIDRPCRPLFPKGFKREVQVIATVLSSDPNIDTDVLAMTGASAALTISDIPFDGPIAGVRVGKINGKFIINPSFEERENAEINMVVAGSSDAIVMVEGGSLEVSENEILEALWFAHKQLQPLIEAQLKLREMVGKEKIEYNITELPDNIQSQVEELAKEKLITAINIPTKQERRKALKNVEEATLEQIAPQDKEDSEELRKWAKSALENLKSDLVREQLFNKGVRIDGRKNNEIRDIDIEIGVLPRTHGSAIFTRGETQAIATATLGVEDEAQRLDNLIGEDFKTFMLHYNFPPFSVGETKPLRGPGRREIGHGALAERAVKAVMPSMSDFPYVIRVVSEITESNGSSSMATVCGASLALMDAGVPIKKNVAGIAMGLLVNENEDYVVLTDILGDEDHLGDMDFKVCGTKDGITALQMDIKIKGLKKEVMEQALNQAKEARDVILNKMDSVISSPRPRVSQYAPRIVTFKIHPDKVRDLIGPGGKTVRSLSEAWDVKINISDDGTVAIAGNNSENLRQAKQACEALTEMAEVGKVYKGVVKRIADFGAFVEILPGTDGLVHISQLAEGRVRSVRDVLQEGDEIWVKVLDVDKSGKIKLSYKDAINEMEKNNAS